MAGMTHEFRCQVSAASSMIHTEMAFGTLKMTNAPQSIRAPNARPMGCHLFPRGTIGSAYGGDVVCRLWKRNGISESS